MKAKAKANLILLYEWISYPFQAKFRLNNQISLDISFQSDVVIAFTSCEQSFNI